MFDKENLPGVLLLGLCGVVCAVLVYSIVTGTTWRFTGPSWVSWVLAIVFIGGSIWGLTQGRGRWPNPSAGRRRWPWQRDDRPPGP